MTTLQPPMREPHRERRRFSWRPEGIGWVYWLAILLLIWLLVV